MRAREVEGCVGLRGGSWGSGSGEMNLVLCVREKKSVVDGRESDVFTCVVLREGRGVKFPSLHCT